MDLFGMMGKMGKLKEEIANLNDEMDAKELHLSGASDMLQITVSGNKEIRNISINESMFRPEFKDELEDQLVVLINQAINEADIQKKAEFKERTEGMMPNIPGLDLSGFGL